MGVVVTRVMDLINDHRIIAVVRNGIRYLPEIYFDAEGKINKFVPGVITLLTDGGYTDSEIIDYLFTADDTLPGRPVDALHGHLARVVMRRTQAMAI